MKQIADILVRHKYTTVVPIISEVGTCFYIIKRKILAVDCWICCYVIYIEWFFFCTIIIRTFLKDLLSAILTFADLTALLTLFFPVMLFQKIEVINK